MARVCYHRADRDVDRSRMARTAISGKPRLGPWSVLARCWRSWSPAPPPRQLQRLPAAAEAAGWLPPAAAVVVVGMAFAAQAGERKPAALAAPTMAPVGWSPA